MAVVGENPINVENKGAITPVGVNFSDLSRSVIERAQANLARGDQPDSAPVGPTEPINDPRPREVEPAA